MLKCQSSKLWKAIVNPWFSNLYESNAIPLYLKAFPLDRLMAIFYSVVDDEVAPSANIQGQIASLVTLQFLMSVGSDDCLDMPKFKCNVGLEFISQMSRQVGFEIQRYLYDFA